MEIKANVYILTAAILLTLDVWTECKAECDSSESDSNYVEQLEFPLELISDVPDGKPKKVIHSVEIVRNNGGTTTKYETTTHTDHDVEEVAENGLFPGITLQSNVPNNYKKVTKKTVIKQQSNNGGQNSKDLGQSMMNAANSQYASQTGSVVIGNQVVLPSTLSQQTAGSSGTVKKTMRTVTSESSVNDLNNLQRLSAIPSDIDVSSMTSSNSNYATTNFLQPTLMGANGKINTMTKSTTTTGTIDGDGSGSVSSSKMSRKPRGSFRHKKSTTIITDIDNVDDSDDGLVQYNIADNGRASMSSNNIASTINSLSSNRLTTNSLKLNSMEGNGQISTMSITGGRSGGDSTSTSAGVNISQKPGGSIKRKKTTTIITDIDNVDDSDDGLVEYNIANNGRTSMSSNNIASTINSLSSNKLTTNSLKLNSMGGNGQMSTTSMMAGGQSGDDSTSTSGTNVSQKPGGLLKHVITSTVKQNSNGGNVYDEFSTHTVGLNNENSISLNTPINMNSKVNSPFKTINTVIENNYEHENLQTGSAESKNNFDSSQTAFNLINLPVDSFGKVQTMSIQGSGNHAEDGLNSQIVKLKLNNNGEMSSLNNNMDYDHLTTGYNSKDYNNINDNGYVIAMCNHIPLNDMSSNSSMGGDSCNCNSKKKRRGKKKNRGGGSKKVVGKNSSKKPKRRNMKTKTNTKTKSTKKSTSEKSNCRSCNQKLNKRNSSSSSGSSGSSSSSSSSSSESNESNESTTNHKPCNHRKGNYYPKINSHESMSSSKSDEIPSILPGMLNMERFLSTNPSMNMNQPPLLKNQEETIYSQQKFVNTDRDYSTESTMNTIPYNIPNIQQNSKLSSQNSKMNQYNSFPPHGPPPDPKLFGQYPPPLPYMSLQDYGESYPAPGLERMPPPPGFGRMPPPSGFGRMPPPPGFGRMPPPPGLGRMPPPPEIKRMPLPPYPLPGMINLIKLPSDEGQQMNDMTTITQNDIENSEFKQMDTLDLESMNTQSSKISSQDSNKGTGYMKTIQTIEKIGSDNPSEMNYVELQSMTSPNEQLFNQFLQLKIIPSNMSYQEFVKVFQLLKQKSLSPPLTPFPSHLNLPFENGQEINYISGSAQMDNKNSELKHLSNLNSEYVTTNIQSSTTSNLYNTQDEDNIKTIKIFENKDDNNYSPDKKNLQTRSYTPQNVQSYAQYIPPFINYQNYGGSASDWRKYLPSFMNSPSVEKTKKQNNNIVQSDNGNSGLKQNINIINSISKPSDTENSMDDNQNGKYTKIIKTTKKMGGDNPKEIHIVESQTMNPGDNGFAYAYSYSY